MKIGYCCKWIDPKFEDKSVTKQMNQRSTTIRHLNSLTKSRAEEKIFDIVNHNIQSLKNQLEWISELPKELKMVRIGSGLVPAAAEPTWNKVYTSNDMQTLLAKNLNHIGNYARKHQIRLSFHPGQFCILNSLKEEVIDRSIQEFEYHVDLAKFLGYGSKWHDYGFAINVHAGSRAAGLDKLVQVVENRLSPEARNLITIENDEFSFGLDDLLPAGKSFAIVLDLHHHWIRTGEYISPDDYRIDQVKESWKGQRPLSHLSTSPEKILNNYSPDCLPNLNELLKQGFNKSQLRAHSDMCWNKAVNAFAIGHLSWTDIEVEAKNKNLASVQLYDQKEQNQEC